MAAASSWCAGWRWRPWLRAGPREGFINTLNTACESLLDEAIPVIPYLSLLSGKPIRHPEEIENLVEDLRLKGDSALSELEDKKKQLDMIMESARAAAAMTGVAQHATRFGKIAQDHANASKQWLIGSTIMLLVTISMAALALFYLPTVGDIKEPGTIQRVIGKLIIISICYFSVLWAAKNYRTHRHLNVLNAHRQSALETFDAFVNASSGDEQTKNAVLLEATRCIFAPANTGYLGGSEDDAQNNRIIEIFKMVGSGSSSK